MKLKAITLIFTGITLIIVGIIIQTNTPHTKHEYKNKAQKQNEPTTNNTSDLIAEDSATNTTSDLIAEGTEQSNVGGEPNAKENTQQQQIFAEFVKNKFAPKYFSVVSNTSYNNFETPTLKIEYKLKETTGVILVNTTWVNEPTNKLIPIATNNAIVAYQKHIKESNEPLFLVVGMGGSAKEPKRLCVIPAKAIKYNNMKAETIEEFVKKNQDTNFFFDLNSKTLK